MLSVDLGAPGLVLAAIGVDLLMLGYLVAVADAVDAGERLRPDLSRVGGRRAGGDASVAGPAAADHAGRAGGPRAGPPVRAGRGRDDRGRAGRTGPPRPGPAGLPARRPAALDRAALLLLAEALPRRRERHRLIATSEDEFLRLTRRALDDFGDRAA